MTKERYEILIPINYNDGRVVEQAKFKLVEEELLALFGGFQEEIEIRGQWVSGGKVYQDILVRYTVDGPDTLDVLIGVKTLKAVWKLRFVQEEIYITSYKVNVI